MKKSDRKDLLEKSLEFRVLQRGDTIFVNLLVSTKSLSFTCKTKNIDIELDTMAFTDMCVVTSFSIAGEEIKTDARIVEAIYKRGHLKCVMSDGAVYKASEREFDFKTISPTIDELKKLIFENVEQF